MRGIVKFGPDHPSAAKLDRTMNLAESQRLDNPKSSAALWAHIDHELVNRAAWVPLLTQRIVDVVSPRLRNYEFSPVYHFMPAPGVASMTGARSSRFEAKQYVPRRTRRNREPVPAACSASVALTELPRRGWPMNCSAAL